MHDLIKQYLVHYGYVETLQALEEQPRPEQENGEIVHNGAA
jgi:hypothetical protein